MAFTAQREELFRLLSVAGRSLAKASPQCELVLTGSSLSQLWVDAVEKVFLYRRAYFKSHGALRVERNDDRVRLITRL